MRRSWRIMAALGLLVAAGSIFMSAWLFTRVQQERERSIRASCTETNARHDDALVKLDRLLLARLEGPVSPALTPAVVQRRLRRALDPLPAARRAEVVRGRTGTVVLIEALVPDRDCERVVERSVQPPPPR